MKMAIRGAVLALILFLTSIANADGEKQKLPGIETCDTWTATLEEMWSYRKWKPEHIALVEKKMEEWKYNQTPIDLKSYSFWSGNDESNLRAFVRDQRFGHAKDSVVIQVDESTRYTLFLCGCGLTAVYLGIKPKPQVIKRRIKRQPPSGGGIEFGVIPDAYCPEVNNTRKRSC